MNPMSFSPLPGVGASDLTGSDATIAAARQGDENAPHDAAYRARARAAAEKFEAFFITEMMRQMRRSASVLADEDSVFKKPVNRDMLELTDTLVADDLSGQHAFGIADVILRQLLPERAQAQDGFKFSGVPVARDVQGDGTGQTP
jgi:Rod binding domain-containing protein